MTGNNETQCYLVQIQIDNYLDGELTANQQDSFINHVQQCAECANEFRYAQTIQDGLVDLPLVDCADNVVDDLISRAQQQGVSVPRSVSPFAEFWQWLSSAPMAIRYGVPAFAVMVLAIGLLPLNPESMSEVPGLATAPAANTAQLTPVSLPASAEYTPEEVLQALQELNLAIQYMNKVSERTETMIGGRFLMTPLRENLNASFERIRDQNDDPLNNDPI